MATFIGTAGSDDFVGADNVKDTFKFDPANLASYDFVAGGNGSTVDTLQFTALGDATDARMQNVSGIERIVLFGGSAVALTHNMLETAFNNTVTVIGTASNDAVYATAADQAYGHVVFNPGAGNDIFVGSSGDDTVSIAPGDLTSFDFFSGGTGGFDTLVLTASGFVSPDQLVNLHGFDQIRLADSGGNIYVPGAAAGSADAGQIFSVIGGTGDDIVNGTLSTAPVKFITGEGANTFYGTSGNDVVVGGSGSDVLWGYDGNDTLRGGDGFDYLNGVAGNDTLNMGAGSGIAYGGEGNDKISSGAGGNASIFGDGGNDTITLHTNDGGYFDVLKYQAESDAGTKGDTVKGDGGSLASSDFRFYFYQGAGAFDTNGAFDTKVNANGTEAGGAGNSVDGADLVLYDGNSSGHVLGSASAVDGYFVSHYYVSTTAGAFLAEKNPDGSVSLYYDADAYHSGGVELIAHILGYNTAVSTLANDILVYT